MKSKILLILAITVAVSGCTEQIGETPYATLVGEVTDRTVEDDSPGEIKLSAENRGNETSFYVIVEPVGDYSEIVEITDRNGDPQNRVELGTAVQGATTGERFAQVRKRLNITSSVKIRAELYDENSDEPVDNRIYRLNLQEN